MITKIATKTHEDWVALRSKYIGGSDAAAVVGLNPFCSAYALWAEKTGRVPSFEGNLATEVGTFLEDFVAKKFEQETGKKVRREKHSILNDEYPWAIANVDRVIVGEDAGLEIKTTSEMNLKKFKGGEYPAQYYVQCVHYMAMTGKKRWYLAVLIGNKDFKWFTIERDEEEIKALMKEEKEFWDHVASNTPPVADGTQSSTNTIGKIFPKSNERVVDLSPYGSALAQYLKLSEQIKELEKMKEEAANIVKQFMADAGEGESLSHRVTWKSATKTTFDHKRFAREHGNINLAPYYKSSTYRTFKVSERT